MANNVSSYWRFSVAIVAIAAVVTPLAFRSCGYLHGGKSTSEVDARSRQPSDAEYVDFGLIQGGKPYRQILELVNSTDDSLLLGPITASCGCISIPSPPSTIPAHGTARLQIVLDTSQGPGPLEYTLLVPDAERTEAVFLFHITATVAGTWSTPAMIDFGEISPDVCEAERDVTVWAAGSREITPTRTECEDKRVSTVLQTLGEGEDTRHNGSSSIPNGHSGRPLQVERALPGSWPVTVKLHCSFDGPAEQVNTNMLVYFAPADTPPLSIPLSYSIRGIAQVIPRTLVFGVVVPGQQVERIVDVTLPDKSSVSLRGATIEADSKEMALKVQIGAANTATIRATLCCDPTKHRDKGQTIDGVVTGRTESGRVLFRVPYTAVLVEGRAAVNKQ